MYEAIFSSFRFFVCSVTALLAQNNGKISYQAVVRNSANELVVNTELEIVVSIANSENGQTVYSEKHTVTSNANGLVSLMIGDGDVLSGSWDAVNWRSAQVTSDIQKQGVPVASHTMPVVAVPYAMTSDYADSVNLEVISNYLEEIGFLNNAGSLIQGLRDSLQDVDAALEQLSDRMNIFNENVCDSVKPCVTGWISDSLALVVVKMYSDSVNLSKQISDSPRMVFDTLH